MLVVDDEPDLCEILQFNLTAAGYTVQTAASAEEALAIGVAGFDLLLLDVMLGGMSGFELAELLKRDTRTCAVPIIFLTALGTETDILEGFGAGADDYIAKPFSVREVLARVKAVLGRVQPRAETLGCGGLVLHAEARTAELDGVPLLLTPTEYYLLHLFLSEPGQVFSREELLRRAWPHDVIVTVRTVDVNITRLRKKLGHYSACIVTRAGFGYSFDKDRVIEATNT